MRAAAILMTVAAGLALPALCVRAQSEEERFSNDAMIRLAVPSTLDDTVQPCLFLPGEGEGPRPLLVFLHTWSNDYTLRTPTWRAEAARRGWHFLQPHFRGPNNTPDACASPKARQDILDAVDHVCAAYAVDTRRVYLAGSSGGGHMTLVMAAHAPRRWTAVSSWCPITDLAAWHAESAASPVAGRRKYAADIEAVVGGPPGSSRKVDRELRFRSPLFHLGRTRGLPIDVATGIHDGYTGSVPIHHTIKAFNAIARVYQAPAVTGRELATLSARQPLDTQEEQDPDFGREIYLRRYAGPSRVTLFEGGHEGIPGAACAWLARHERPTR